MNGDPNVGLAFLIADLLSFDRVVDSFGSAHPVPLIFMKAKPARKNSMAKHKAETLWACRRDILMCLLDRLDVMTTDVVNT